MTMESAKTSKKKEDEKWCDGFSGYSNHLGETDEQQEHQRKSTAFLSGKGLLQRARKSCGIGPLIDVAEGLAGKRFKLHTVNIICPHASTAYTYHSDKHEVTHQVSKLTLVMELSGDGKSTMHIGGDDKEIAHFEL